MIHKPDKPLIKTNPYLQDPKQRKIQFIAAVIGSSAVEGVVIAPSQLEKSSKRTAKRK